MQNPAPSEEHFGQLPEIMMNAYFPQKRLFRGRREWSMRNGRYEIQVRANATIPSCDKREIDNKPEVEVPYGFAARVILPYLFGRALRGEPVVKIGPNLNQIFLDLRLPRTGRNYKTIEQQLKNVLTADITIVKHIAPSDGTSNCITVKTNIWSKPAWWGDSGRIYRDLSPSCYKLIHRTAVPVNMQHLVLFTKSPRRMDLYMWLSCRAPWIPEKRKEVIPLRPLQALFAPDMNRKFYRMFKKRLCEDIFVIRSVHKGFDVEVSGDVLILRHSDPPVPFRPPRGKYTR